MSNKLVIKTANIQVNIVSEENNIERILDQLLQLNILGSVNNVDVISNKDASNTKEDRSLFAFRCTNCDSTAVIYADPTKKVKCLHCEEPPRFLNTLFKANVHCDCGKDTIFMMEEAVSELKCIQCKKFHPLEWSNIEDKFVSIFNN